MLKAIVLVCLAATLAGCASATPQFMTKEVAYLDADGKVKTKTVQVPVVAPAKQGPMVTTYKNQSLAFKG